MHISYGILVPPGGALPTTIDIFSNGYTAMAGVPCRGGAAPPPPGAALPATSNAFNNWYARGLIFFG